MTLKDKISLPIAAILMLAILGLFLAAPVIAFENLHKAHQAETWPITTGTVTQSSWTYGRRASHQINFHYDYSVDGKNYTGERYVFHSTWTYGDQQTVKIVRENPIGSQVDVHYSPLDPSDSVIVPGKISSSLWMVLYIVFPFDLLILFIIGAVIRYNLTRTPEQKAREKARWDQVAAQREQYNANYPNRDPNP